MDKISVPAQLIRAHVDLAAAQWSDENQGNSCPRTVRSDIREQVEKDLARKSLPVPRIYEISWHLGEGWLLFHGHSDRINTLFARSFFRTFNLELIPDNPLDWLADEALASALESSGATVGAAESEERPHV